MVCEYLVDSRIESNKDSLCNRKTLLSKTRLSRLSKLPPAYDMFSFSRDVLSAGDGSVLTITKPSSRTPNLHVVRTVIDNLTLRTTTNWFNEQALYEPLKMIWDIKEHQINAQRCWNLEFNWHQLLAFHYHNLDLKYLRSLMIQCWYQLNLPQHKGSLKRKSSKNC